MGSCALAVFKERSWSWIAGAGFPPSPPVAEATAGLERTIIDYDMARYMD